MTCSGTQRTMEDDHQVDEAKNKDTTSLNSTLDKNLKNFGKKYTDWDNHRSATLKLNGTVSQNNSIQELHIIK